MRTPESFEAGSAWYTAGATCFSAAPAVVDEGQARGPARIAAQSQATAARR
ncbi:MAG: hypothetical protein ACYTG0_29875 [Planctomycetota bacterium]